VLELELEELGELRVAGLDLFLVAYLW